MSDKYVLDENSIAVVEPDLMKWAAWFETADRQVAGQLRVKHDVNVGEASGVQENDPQASPGQGDGGVDGDARFSDAPFAADESEDPPGRPPVSVSVDSILFHPCSVHWIR